MKKLLLLALLFAALSASAQTGTLSTPDNSNRTIVTTTALAARTNLLVGQVREQRVDPNDPTSFTSITIDIWPMTAGGLRGPDSDTIRITLTANADVSGYLGAIETTFTGEVAGTTLAARARRHNGRILDYLITNCATFTPSCAAQLSSATMVP